MREILFSDEYIEKLEKIKSFDYLESLYSGIDRLKAYMLEEEYREVFEAIEDVVEPKSNGNIITTHSYGTFSQWLLDDTESFIQLMVEDLQDWFMFDINPIKCRLFCIGIHIDDYEFSDNDLEKITYAIMINFIENGISCPDVVLLPTQDYKKKMENGYFIMGLE